MGAGRFNWTNDIAGVGIACGVLFNGDDFVT